MNILIKIKNIFISPKMYSEEYFFRKYDIDNAINNGMLVDKHNLAIDFGKAYEQVRKQKPISKYADS